MRSTPPRIIGRSIRGPPKPWEEHLTALQRVAYQPSYVPYSQQWATLPEADLQAAFAAARAAIPGQAPLPRWRMVSTVLGWFHAQEVALSWAVVKYAELVSVSVTAPLQYA